MNIIETKDEDATLTPNEKDENEDEDEENYDIRFGSQNTTLRKSAAYTLGAFSKMFPQQTFQVLQPVFDQAFQLTLVDPKKMVNFHINTGLDLKEAAILTLGSISDQDGCFSDME